MEKKHMNLIAKTFMTFAIVFAIVLVGKLPVEAATAPTQKVTGVKETVANQTAFRLEWGAVPGADLYEIKVATTKTGNYQSIGYIQATAVTLTGSDIPNMKANSSYWVKVSAVAVGDDGNGNRIPLPGPESDSFEAVTSPYTPTSIVHVKSDTNKIYLSWTASLGGASAYEVDYKLSADSWNSAKTVSATAANLTLSNLTKNREYDVEVYAKRVSSTGGFSAYSNPATKNKIPVKPSKVTGVKAIYPYPSYSSKYKRINKITVGCTGMEASDGYQYEIYTAGKGKSTKITSKKAMGVYQNVVDISKSKLKDNRFIKIRVRACYNNSKGTATWGAWSDWKYTCQQPMLNKNKTKSTSSGIKVAWSKVEGANRYVVYASTKQKSGYKKVGTTTKDNLTIKKCGSSKLKNGKKYYFYVVAQKKVSGKYVSGDDAYCWSMTYRK